MLASSLAFLQVLGTPSDSLIPRPFLRLLGAQKEGVPKTRRMGQGTRLTGI